MANSLTVTTAEVIDFNLLATNTNQNAITQRIPLAQSYVNDQLNNAYDPDEHGKEVEYLAAIKAYVFYLYVDKASFISLNGIGQLKEETVDKIYMTPHEISKKKADLLTEVNSYIETVKTAMKTVDSDIIDVSDNIQQMGNVLYVIGCGGNSDYKTNYGLGMQQDDDDLREVLPNVE